MRLFLCVSLLISSCAFAQVVPPPNDPSLVAIDAQSSVVGSRSVVVSLSATTAVDIWTLLPTELKSNILPMIRYVTIQNASASTTPFASEYVSGQIGGAAPTANVGLRIFSGAAWQPQVRRPNRTAVFNGTFPEGPIPIWVYPSHAVDAVVTWYW